MGLKHLKTSKRALRFAVPSGPADFNQAAFKVQVAGLQAQQFAGTHASHRSEREKCLRLRSRGDDRSYRIRGKESCASAFCAGWQRPRLEAYLECPFTHVLLLTLLLRESKDAPVLWTYLAVSLRIAMSPIERV